MYKAIEQGIKKAVEELGLPEVAFSLEHPKELSHGDYMTNAAILVAKHSEAKPRYVAEQITQKLTEENIEGVERIEVAGPGFINFTLKREIFIDQLVLAQDQEWGNTEVYKDKKILIEHSSPNLFKPFHIGHLMNNTVGEALYRLAKSSGAKATPISFPSDISLGVAKAIFILLEKIKNGAIDIDEDVVEYGKAYTEGVKRYDEDETIHPRVKEIADNLYAQKPSDEWDMFIRCKGINIAYFEKITKELGSEFDSYIYESEAGVEGMNIVEDNTPKVFTESEGAVVYIPSEERKDINTSVFINSQGNPTYEAKDIGLIALKFEKYNPDLSIYVTDNQQMEHFKVVFDAMSHINEPWATKSIHRYHGRMSFKGAKMSSRLGNVPTVEGMLSAVVEEVKEKNPDVSEEVSKQVAIASIKFSILRTQTGKDINFDPDTSLSFEGDSGPYLQYTAVRAGSLLEKGKALGITPNTDAPVSGTEILERLIPRFIEVCAEAQKAWAPHYVVTYLLELAQAFNSWYGQGKILDEDVSATAYRLSVVVAARQTIINGLWVLGIDVPEKM